MALTISDISEAIALLQKTDCGKILGGGTTNIEKFMLSQDVKDAVLDVHPYKISSCKTGWTTKVKSRTPTKDDGRTTLTSPTEAGLYLKLVEWYSIDTHRNKMTLNDLFNEWMEYRKKTAAKPGTLLRNQQHYRKYFEGTDFFNKELLSIKRPELKSFCYSVIKGETAAGGGPHSDDMEKHLTRKEWTNVMTILNGMFSYALECDYIQNDPMQNMKFENALFRAPRTKRKTDEIYNTEEEEELICWCADRFKKTGDSAALFPVLTLNIGTRIGETVALRWDDWVDGKYLIISKQEISDKTSKSVSVVPYTKTHRPRKVPLSDTAIDVLNAIKGTSDGSDWIFSRNGCRVTARQAEYVLEMYAKETGTKLKSSHKLRKTCGSNLYKRCNFTPKQCSDYLGNSERVFEDYYLFDTDTDEELFEKLNQNVPLLP